MSEKRTEAREQSIISPSLHSPFADASMSSHSKRINFWFQSRQSLIFLSNDSRILSLRRINFEAIKSLAFNDDASSLLCLRATKKDSQLLWFILLCRDLFGFRFVLTLPLVGKENTYRKRNWINSKTFTRITLAHLSRTWHERSHQPAEVFNCRKWNVTTSSHDTNISLLSHEIVTLFSFFSQRRRLYNLFKKLFNSPLRRFQKISFLVSFPFSAIEWMESKNFAAFSLLHETSLLLLLDRWKLNWSWREKRAEDIFLIMEKLQCVYGKPKSERRKGRQQPPRVIVMWTVLCLYLLWLFVAVACLSVIMRTPGWFFFIATPSCCYAESVQSDLTERWMGVKELLKHSRATIETLSLQSAKAHRELK